MPGFERNRFVGLEDSIADGFTCIVCFNIFENPVITDCGHTYCFECIENSIKSGSNDCPKCRKSFRHKESNGTTNNDNLVAIEHNQYFYIFVRNLTVNAIISQLKIKCEYEWNGCNVVLELGLLESHLKHCEHQICTTCGNTVSNDEHNCIELMKNDVNEWKIKCKQFELSLNELRDKHSELTEQNQKNVKLKDEWKTKCEKYGKRVDQLVKKCSQLETENRSNGTMINEWKHKCISIWESLKEENRNLKQDNRKYLKEINESKDNISQITNKLDDMNAKFTDLHKQYQMVLEANNELKRNTDNHERSLYQLVSQISLLESENNSVAKDNTHLTLKCNEYEKTIEELKKKVFKLQTEVQEKPIVSVDKKESNKSVPHSRSSKDKCNICGLIAGSAEEHNCLKLLAKEANRWKIKFEESEQTLAKIRDKYAGVVRDNLINIRESYRWRERSENFENMAKELKRNMARIEDKLRVCSLNFVNKEMSKWRQRCNQFERNLNEIDRKYSKSCEKQMNRNFGSKDIPIIEKDLNSKEMNSNDKKMERLENNCKVNDKRCRDRNDCDRNQLQSKQNTYQSIKFEISAKQSLMYTENVGYIIFGTFRTKCTNFHINCNGVLLKGVSPKTSQDLIIAPKDIIIPFQSMKELKFCSKLFSMALLIKATDVCTLDIQRLLNLSLPSRQSQSSKYFSYDLNENNIIIALNKKNQNLLQSMSEWLVAANPQLKTESINWFKMKEIMDRIHS